MPSLTVALAVSVVTNGVTLTRDGRLFLVLSRIDGSDGPRVGEWVGGELEPYPDAAWNAWSPGQEAANGLVRVNSLRIGPDGDLWLVDVGAPGIGNPKLVGGPKIVQVDLASNTVRRTNGLDAATNEASFVDDIRFNGRIAYITDAGSPGLIVLDLDTGKARRALDGDTSTRAQRPITAEGRTVYGPDGNPVYLHADQLEVSPDGNWLYYQPCTGPLYRIETRWLDDASVTDAERVKHVELVAETPTTGGTAIDSEGNLYISDTDRQLVLKVAPDGSTSTLIQDGRLLWVDAMWIDDAGYFWMPAAQLNRMAPFQGGNSMVQFPVNVYKLQIGAKPAPIDHP
jgi:sugar lactone lactonase YvrE